MKRVQYPLDYTGIASTNLITNELHTLTGSSNRLLTPEYGPFYSSSLIITDTITNTVLVKDTDYEIHQLEPYLTATTGKDISILVLIINNAINANVSIRYQTVGGAFVTSAKALVQNLIDTKLDDQTVNWKQVLEKPTAYQPSHHLHDSRDTYGWEYVVQEMDRVNLAINNATLEGPGSRIEALSILADTLLNAHKTSEAHDPTYYLKTLTYSKQEYDSKFFNIADFSTFVNVDGPTQLTQGKTGRYLITNYDSNNIYSVSLPGATIAWFNWGNDIYGSDGFSITLPDNYPTGINNITITCNDNIRQLPLDVLEGIKVSILAPTLSGALSSGSPTATFSGTAFTTINGSDTPVCAEIVLTNTANNSVIATTDFNAVNNVLTGSYTFSNLPLSTTFTAKMRYKGVLAGWSAWSNILTFTTKADYTVIPSAVVDRPTVTAIMSTSSPAVTIVGSKLHISTGVTDDLVAYGIIIYNTTTNKLEFRDDLSGIPTGMDHLVFDYKALAVNCSYTVSIMYKSATYGWSEWSLLASFSTQASYTPDITINPPAITGTQSNSAPAVTFTGSSFSYRSNSGLTDTMAAYSYRVVSDAGVVVQSATSVSATTPPTITCSNLAVNTTYNVYMEYKGATYGWSSWSNAFTFKTYSDYTSKQFQVNYALAASVVAAPVDATRYQIAILYYFNVAGYTSDQFDIIGFSGSSTLSAPSYQIKGRVTTSGGVTTFTLVPLNEGDWNILLPASNNNVFVVNSSVNNTFSKALSTSDFSSGSVSLGGSTYTPFKYYTTIQSLNVVGNSGGSLYEMDNLATYVTIDSTTRTAIQKAINLNYSVLSSTGIAWPMPNLMIRLKQQYWPTGNYTYY